MDDFTVAFSETVLGRFLRAISVYILLLWNLVSMFHGRHIPRPHLDDQEALTTAAKLEKLKDLTVKETDTELARFPQGTTESVVALELSKHANGQRPSLRVSTASRLSAIVDRVEKNEALAEITRTLSSRSIRKSPVATTPKRPKRPELRFDIITPTLPSTIESLEEPPTTGISLSYYTMNPSSSDVPTIRRPLDNPTQPFESQLDGQGNPGHASHTSLITQPPSQITCISFIDELMRQQNELDKSIAKLKLLSMDMKDTQASEEAPTLDNSSTVVRENVASVKTRSQSTTRTGSLSPRSEFSLSVFPIPPLTSESATEDRQLSKPNIRKLPEPPTIASNQTIPLGSVPDSPSQASTVARMMSGGTQYDVTSFIGSKPRHFHMPFCSLPRYRFD
jgi:hypothetical protein